MVLSDWSAFLVPNRDTSYVKVRKLNTSKHCMRAFVFFYFKCVVELQKSTLFQVTRQSVSLVRMQRISMKYIINAKAIYMTYILRMSSVNENEGYKLSTVY